MHPLIERIETARAKQQLSYRQLADAAAIPRETLSRRLSDPASFTLAELARVFNALNIKATTVNVRDAA